MVSVVGVEPGDQEGHEVDEARLAGRGEVAEERGERDPRTPRRRWRRRCRRCRATWIASWRGGVGVEVPVALFGRGVAPAQREVRQAGRDGGFDEAAPRCEIGDVVLVDLRRDDHQRAPVDLRRGLVVLDQLEHLGAVHDVPWRDPEVAADGEGPRVDLRRHAAVVTQVVRAVPRPRRRSGPRLGGLRHRVGVGQQEVRRRERLGEQRHVAKVAARLLVSSSTSSMTRCAAPLSTRYACMRRRNTGFCCPPRR